MFSGIVEEMGKILAVSDSSGGRTLTIGAPTATGDLKVGDSVSVNGCCLTVTKRSTDSFQADATWQTLRMTGLGALRTGCRVNLERALKLSDRLGGHLVTGHIDGTGELIAAEAEGFSRIMTFKLDTRHAPYLVEKGSIAVDGVSLTVACLDFAGGSMIDRGQTLSFTVAVIPQTLAMTTLGGLKVGSEVNIECDLIGKYAAAWLDPTRSKNINKEALSRPFLIEHGYT